MRELASPGQLRMSFVRWALVAVPAIVFCGFVSGRLSRTAAGDRWYDALVKPDAMPPPAAFGIAWSLLYVLIGLALALVLNARGSRFRGYALALFGVQFALNLSWSPTFFGARQVLPAFVLLCAILTAALATTIAFGRVRRLAAWLMVPYLVWLSFASILNWQTHALNPGASALVPERPRTQIAL